VACSAVFYRDAMWEPSARVQCSIEMYCANQVAHSAVLFKDTLWEPIDQSAVLFRDALCEPSVTQRSIL